MDYESHLKTATALTHVLENRFKVLGVRFGLDAVLGVIPWVGDVVTLFLSLYIVWIGIQLKLPSDRIALMVKNVIVDFFLGIIPVLGDVADFVFRANSKNLAIINKYREEFREGDVIEARHRVGSI